MRSRGTRRVRRSISFVVAAGLGAVLLPTVADPVEAVAAPLPRVSASAVAVAGAATMADAGAEDERGEDAAAQVGAVTDSAATGAGEDIAVPPSPPGANPTSADVTRPPLPPPAELPEPAPVVEVGRGPPAAGSSTAEPAEPHPDAVEVVDKRTQTTRTYANPDGTFTLEARTGPIHAGEDGEWVPVEVDLREGEDGVLVNGPAAVDLEVAEVASADRLVTVAVGPGRSLGYALEGAADVPAEVDGAVARYPGVFPGVDLELEHAPAGSRRIWSWPRSRPDRSSGSPWRPRT